LAGEPIALDTCGLGKAGRYSNVDNFDLPNQFGPSLYQAADF
jgi:hypothetical protein